MELFTKDDLSHIASTIGIPWYRDKATELRRRVNFARVCVEVGYADDLPDAITINIEG